MQHHFNFIILVFGTVNIIWSQSPNMEIAGFEYTTIPDVGGASVEKYSMNLNLGKKFKNRGVLGLGVSYDYHDFIFNNASLSFDARPYESMHRITADFSFKYNINTTWSTDVIFAPSLSSNFEESLSNEDIVINSSLTLSKSWGEEKSSLFTFGIGYGTLLGKPQLIPLVSFQKKVNSKWNYIVGIPKTEINYHFNSRHKIAVLAGLRGFFGNISSTVNFPGIGPFTNTKLQYNSLDTGINYTYRIQPNWTTIIKVGYSPWNQLEILDSENNEIYDFEPDSSLFISMGLKFNLNK